jgi:predicted metal-dependent phosphoesterase TrpH
MTAGALRFDLQAHSTCSDGELAPAEVVAAAHAAGVEVLSLTDHDNVDGVTPAAAAARELGVRLIEGVEITTAADERTELHILGYLIDTGDPPLRAQLAASRGEREARAARMAQALRELGFSVEEEAAEELAGEAGAVGRPHLAQAVVNDPRNRQRLLEEGLLEPSSFLEAYLIEGRPAFRRREAPSVEQAISLIHGAGGVAVWAHPFWDISEPPDVIARLERFAELGLDGVEAFYLTHTQDQAALMVEQCSRRGLLTTGSSDFHGPGHRRFSRFLAFETYGLAPDLGPLV